MTEGPWNSMLAPTTGPRPGRVAPMHEVLDAIEDGARIHLGSGGGLPRGVLDAISEGRERWAGLEMTAGYLVGGHALFDEADGPVYLRSLQPSGAIRDGVNGGWISVVPSSLSQWASIVDPDGPLPADVAVVMVSPAGPDGRHSLGISGADAVEVIRRAPLVIGQINDQMPYTFGATEVDQTAFDLLVEAHHPLAEIPTTEPTDVDRAIADHAAALIGDGATIQFGVGAMPAAVLGQLTDRRNLSVHSGMLGDAVIDLHEAGVLTGSPTSPDPGLLIGGMVIGTRVVYDWVHRHPDVRIVPSCYSHGIPVISQLRNLVAVNSAVEVALDGSINAEAAGGRTLSGPGGQPDYAVGASLSPGGVSIIALPSTAARGTRSRIVGRLDPDAPTTVSRHLADRVVTEFGVASLRGRTIEQRAADLRAIAHPSLSGQL